MLLLRLTVALVVFVESVLATTLLTMVATRSDINAIAAGEVNSALIAEALDLELCVLDVLDFAVGKGVGRQGDELTKENYKSLYFN